MFNKVVSNLAFSPSAMDQVAFYARRLRQEDSIRRLGLILIVFSMLIQIFAATAPPEKSLAASNNDVIYGGIRSIGDLRNKYNSQADVRALYDRFGLGSNSMNTTGSAKNTSFNFKEQGSKGTRTVGRVNFSSTRDHNLGKFAGTTFYSRSAAEWSGSTDAYYFDKQKGTDGRYYYVWVLKDCGNIAYRLADSTVGTTGPATPINQPAPAKPAPAPKPVPTTTPNVQPKPALSLPSPKPAPATTTTFVEAVCEDNPALKPDDANCLAPSRAKQATNLSQQLTPEQTPKSTARPGDIIEYRLVSTNPASSPRSNYLIEDYIGDLLDYADVDQEFLANQGGAFNPNTKTVSWSKQTLPAKGQLQKVFRVKVKQVIPSSNRPNATSTDFDCKMQNGYGNEISIDVACSPLKTVETLPNTGPGEAIGASAAVSVLSGFFFLRGRLLAKELRIIKRYYQAGA